MLSVLRKVFGFENALQLTGLAKRKIDGLFNNVTCLVLGVDLVVRLKRFYCDKILHTSDESAYLF